MSAEPADRLEHATCVAIAGRGVLLLGRSGSGKSDLALRLIDHPGRGAGRRALAARLVADDQVQLTVRDGRLFASAPDPIAGLIEIRGLGILRLARLRRAEIALAVRLVEPGQIERLPEPGERLELQGVAVPLLRLAPFEGSAEAKVRAALLGRRGAA
jgi:HPr kinase/phosphorylase